jgi:hypothetical protein
VCYKTCFFTQNIVNSVVVKFCEYGTNHCKLQLCICYQPLASRNAHPRSEWLFNRLISFVTPLEICIKAVWVNPSIPFQPYTKLYQASGSRLEDHQFRKCWPGPIRQRSSEHEPNFFGSTSQPKKWYKSRVWLIGFTSGKNMKKHQWHDRPYPLLIKHALENPYGIFFRWFPR